MGGAFLRTIQPEANTQKQCDELDFYYVFHQMMFNDSND